MIATCPSAMQGEKQRKGQWTEEEDKRLVSLVKVLGERKWDSIARESGLGRSGKSCRMRWLNYLRPSIKRGHISAEEEQIIVNLQHLWGNKWSKIARKLPGRTDNEIKNYWKTYLRKRAEAHEEGDYQFETEKGKQDSMYQNCSKGIPQGSTDINKDHHHHEHHKYVKNNTTEVADCWPLDELSSMAYPCSPFEIRVFDWLPELSGSDHTKIHQNWGGNGGIGSCLCSYLACRCNEDSGSSRILSDYSFCSLWDMS